MYVSIEAFINLQIFLDINKMCLNAPIQGVVYPKITDILVNSTHK